MYIAKDFKGYATPLEFFRQLKEYIASLGLFTVTEENLSETPYSFKLQYKNAVIKLECNNNNVIVCDCCLLIKDTEVSKVKNSVLISNANSTQQMSCSVKVLLIKNNDNILFKLGSYNSELLGYTNAVRVVIFDNELYCFAISNTTSANASDINDTSYTYKPYHTYPKSPTELFLDPELPWTNANDGSFNSNSVGITGLGGAECGKLYQLEDGSKYYTIFNNMAILMGEEVEGIV